MTTKIAVVDDAERMAEVLAMVLRAAGHHATAYREPAVFLDELRAEPDRFDVVLTDLKMPQIDGLELLRRALAVAPELPIILVTAHGTIATAIEAMKHGAFDYLQKPVDNDKCRATVQRALQHSALARENRYLRGQLEQKWGIAGVIAVSEEMQRVLELARRAAASSATVLLTGESGTGKEVVARLIHAHSKRVGGAFEAVNCKAFASGVLESELFGHERGAYTGADRARAGVFERADGGTLLLDEIGEIDGSFQAKLLRVLQEGEVQRVGGDRPRPVDVRVIAATRRDLAEDARSGAFRDDLYFRLAVIPIEVPPLRRRRDDIVPLARHFLTQANRAQGRRLAGWSPEVGDWLVEHSWPGNVRELENTIERGVVLARGEVVEMDDLLVTRPVTRDAHAGDSDAVSGPLNTFLERQAERRIRAALDTANGVRIDAANALGIERTTLYRLMRKYGIE